MGWFLSNRSHLFQFLQKNAFHTHYGSFRNIFEHFTVNINTRNRYPGWDHPLFLKEELPIVRRAKALFEALLLEINLLCLKNECTLVVVMLPTKMEFNAELHDVKYEAGKIANFVRHITTKNNIHFLDLYSVLKEEKERLSIFIAHEYHFNERGHRFVGEQIFDYFINNFI